MARHVPDDFSFLPTVDSTDEEIMENELARESPQTPPEPEAYVSADEAAFEQVPEHEEVPVAAPTPPPAIEPAKAVPSFEPKAAPPLNPQPTSERVARQADESPAKVQPPSQPAPLSKAEDDVPMPTPRAPQVARLSDDRQRSPVVGATPLVSFGGTKAKKSVEPEVSPLPRITDSSADKPKVGKATQVLKDPKPFIAPKPPPEEPMDPDMVKKKRWLDLKEKVGLSTLGMSFGVHLFLLLIAGFIGVSQVMERQVDFLPGGSSPQSQAAADALTHKIQNKKNPWVKAKPPMRKLSVQSVSANIVLPEMPAMDMMDFSKINDHMSISKAAAMGGSPSTAQGLGGAGGGFGAGIGKGGQFTFLGQTAMGRRVVFVVDVSGSMSQALKVDGPRVTRFDLMKKELIKAVKQVPPGTAYQVLFFSDFAWPHNQVDSRNADALAKYHWEIKPDDYKRVKIPTFKYIQANPFTVQESVEIIQNADNPGLTNWGSGLLMALNANPKPDVIFFMTDGERQDEMGWIDIVTDENKRKQPMATIHTSVMAQTDAAREMDALAKRNNGKFTVVMSDGRVVKGDDFFKMK